MANVARRGSPQRSVGSKGGVPDKDVWQLYGSLGQSLLVSFIIYTAVCGFPRNSWRNGINHGEGSLFVNANFFTFGMENKIYAYHSFDN